MKCIKREISRMIALLLAVAMIVTMMPQEALAVRAAEVTEADNGADKLENVEEGDIPNPSGEDDETHLDDPVGEGTDDGNPGGAERTPMNPAQAKSSLTQPA